MPRASGKVSELIKDGVDHFRNAQYDHARVCWEVALELAPDDLHIKKYLQLLDDKPEAAASTAMSSEGEEDRATYEEIPAINSNKSRAPGETALPPYAAPQAPVSQDWSSPGTLRANPQRQQTGEVVTQMEVDSANMSKSDLWAVTSELELPLESMVSQKKKGQPKAEPPGLSPASSATHSAVTPDLLDQERQNNQASPHQTGTLRVLQAADPQYSEIEALRKADVPGLVPPSAGPLDAREMQGEQTLGEERFSASAGQQALAQADASVAASVPKPAFHFHDGPSSGFASIEGEETASPGFDLVQGVGAPDAVVLVDEEAPATPATPAPVKTKPPALDGATLAKALDSALAKEFSALLGDNVTWPQQDDPEQESTGAVFDPDLSMPEYTKVLLEQMLTIDDNTKRIDVLNAFLKRDISTIIHHWPLAEAITDGLKLYFDTFFRHAMNLYINREYLAAYRLFLLCFCARPEDARVQSNLEKLKKRLEIK